MLLLDLNCSTEFYWSEVDFFDVFTDFVDETISPGWTSGPLFLRSE